MGRRGPRPTPTTELERRGSWRAKTRDGEPRPETSVPDPPAWVKGAAREHWATIAEELAKLDLMADVHSPALGLLVDSLARYIELREIVGKYGYTVTTDKGNEIQRPEVGAMHKAWEHVFKALREFGMTPAAMTSIRVGGPDQQENDGKDRFFNARLAG